MFGNQQNLRTVGSHTSAKHLQDAALGPASNLFYPTIRDVDDVLGYRAGQPLAIRSHRTPRVKLNMQFRNGTTSNQPVQMPLNRTITNVTSVELFSVVVTGLAAPQNTLFLDFRG